MNKHIKILKQFKIATSLEINNGEYFSCTTDDVLNVSEFKDENGKYFGSWNSSDLIEGDSLDDIMPNDTEYKIVELNTHIIDTITDDAKIIGYGSNPLKFWQLEKPLRLEIIRALRLS